MGNSNPTCAGKDLRYPRGTELTVPPFDGDTEIPTDADFKVLYRQALKQACSVDDLKFVISRLIECAKRGEAWAVKEVMDRFAGKPVQALDVSDTKAERLMSEGEAMEVLKAHGFVSLPPSPSVKVSPDQPATPLNPDTADGSTVKP